MLSDFGYTNIDLDVLELFLDLYLKQWRRCSKFTRSHYSFSGRSMCVCGAQHVLADDMLPNNTVRDTINRILVANNSGGDNKGSAFQIQGLQSFLHLQCI